MSETKQRISLIFSEPTSIPNGAVIGYLGELNEALFRPTPYSEPTTVPIIAAPNTAPDLDAQLWEIIGDRMETTDDVADAITRIKKLFGVGE